MTAPGSSRAAVTPLLVGMGWPDGQPGGLNRYFEGLVHALDDDGGPDPAGVVIGPAHDLPAGVVAVSDHRRGLLPRLLAVRAAVAERAPNVDVLDTHFALTGWAARTVPAARRLPLVVHFQGPWADEVASAGRGGRLRVAGARLLERSTYRRAAAAIVLSAAFKRVLVERYGLSPWVVHVEPPGVDLERFRPGDRNAARARLGLASDAWVVVCVRRLVPRMGLDVLLDAWAAVDRGPDDRLVVVGDGDLRGELARRAARLRISDSVELRGREHDDALLACYQAADVSVVPSLELEGYGLVTLESLACGVPTVTTDVGGLPEAVSGLDPSLVVAAGDAAALRARLEDGRAGRRPFPSSARCRAHAEGHTWRAVAARHRDRYAEAAGRGGHDRLRVVYLGHTAALSGGELALLRLLPALEDVDAHVILGEDGPLVGLLTRAGISVEVLPMASAARSLRRDDVSSSGGRGAAMAALQAAAYSARLAVRIHHLQPDVVHTNTLKAALYGGGAARAVGVPVVWHVRDRIAPDYLPGGAVRLMRGLSRVVPQAIVANSKTTLATLPGGWWTPDRWVVPSPVATPLVVSARPDGRPFTVAMIGRLAPWKGQHVFLEAFARAFPSGDARAVVAGSALFGEHDHAEDLRRQVTDLGLGGRVDLAGHIDDVPALLAEVDVVVHASVVPEPFGQVVAEGMAAGLAVVAADAGGPAELITDGHDGLLCPPGDVDALAAALVRLSEDPALRRRLGTAARSSGQHLTPSIVAEQLTFVYRRLLGVRGSPSSRP